MCHPQPPQGGQNLIFSPLEGVGGEKKYLLTPQPFLRITKSRLSKGAPRSPRPDVIRNLKPIIYSLLVFLCVIGTLVGNLPKSYAQSNNKAVYDHLVESFRDSILQLNQLQIDSINRSENPFLKSISSFMAYSGDEPRISYKAIGKNQFIREISSIEKYTFAKDTVENSQTLTYSDTLTSKQLKQVQKTSPKDFRAEMPTTSAKIITPFIIVVGSIGGVVSLFYIRSR